MSTITATSAGSAAAGTSGQGAGALQAQKAQCERQLADWVHCVSASTPEGKAKIAEYSSKLSAINAQLKKADDARQAGQAQPAIATAPAAGASSTLGSRVDVYA
jgi:hypothetical protein